MLEEIILQFKDVVMYLTTNFDRLQELPRVAKMHVKNNKTSFFAVQFSGTSRLFSLVGVCVRSFDQCVFFYVQD